jgi:hypothetical protein
MGILGIGGSINASGGGTNFAAGVAGTLLGGVTGGSGLGAFGAGGGMGGELDRMEALFQKQVEVQLNSQEFGLRVGISKAYHDAGMEAVRTIKG